MCDWLVWRDANCDWLIEIDVIGWLKWLMAHLHQSLLFVYC